MPTLKVLCTQAQTATRTMTVRRALAKSLRALATRLDGHTGPEVDLGAFSLLGAPERDECLRFAEGQLRKAAHDANQLMFEELVMQQKHPALFEGLPQQSGGPVALHRRV